MKRAKAPPPAELVRECSVFADLLALGKRDAITTSTAVQVAWPHDDVATNIILRHLTHLAMAEYLRRFPDVRKPNNDPWHIEPQTHTVERVDPPSIFGTALRVGARRIRVTESTGEVDYQCFFCRKSLYTRPERKRLAKKPRENMIKHTEACAVRLLAGLLKPHKPLPKGTPGL